MKRLSVIALMCFAIEAGLAAGPEASSRDITHGNVRVVLMSVSQTAVFPNDADQDNPHRGTKDSVSCFTVTVLVEALGDKPFKQTSSLDVEVLSAGQPISMPDWHGTYHQDFDYHVFQGFLDFTKPKVSSPKRAFIRRYVRFDSVPNLQPFDLLIKTGFDQDIQKFELNSISLK